MNTEKLVKKVNKHENKDIPELREQLDTKAKEITTNTNTINALQTQVNSVVSGSPKGVYPTLSTLTSAFPTGNSNIYVVSSDGCWYYWNDSAWTKGGTYQSTGIQNYSITDEKIAKNTKLVFKKPNKNLLDLDSLINGYYVDYTNGNTVVNANYSITDYIELLPNTTYTLSNPNNTLEQFAFYDSNKVYVSGWWQSGQKSVTFTTSENVNYARLTLQNTAKALTQLEHGNIATRYEDYKATFSGEDITDYTITDEKIDKSSNIVVKSAGRNLLDLSLITDGYYIDYRNGNVTALQGYSVSDYIEIDSNVSMVLSNFDSKSTALEQLAFYDYNKTYVSGLTNTGEVGYSVFTTPVNAKYIRLTLRNSNKSYIMLEYGTIKTTYEKYDRSIKVNEIEKGKFSIDYFDSALQNAIKTKKIITVKQDGTGDYTNLRLALEKTLDSNITNQYEIQLYPGTYNIMEYYTSDEINNTGFIGLIKPNYVSLIGVGDCDEIILNGELDATYSSTTMKRVSTLVTYGEGELRNLTVKAKNLRYAVHDDYQFENTTLKTENCKFLKYKSDVFTDYPQPYGGGLFSGMKRKFKKCYFFTDSSSYPFSFHNNVGLTSPVEIEIEDCQFEGVGTTTSICFLSMGSGTKDKVKMKGCRLNGAKILLKENIAGVGCDFELTGYSNDKVPYDFTVTNGKQYVYNFVGEHLTVHNSSSSVITKGTPVKYSLQANNSGVIPLATADDKSVMLGVAFEDIQPQQRGTIRIDGYLAIKDTSLSGLSEGNKVGVVNGVLAKVTSGDYIGVVVWGSWIRLKF